MLGTVTRAGDKSVNKAVKNLPALAEFGSPVSNVRADGFLSEFAYIGLPCFITFYCASQILSFLYIEGKTLHQPKDYDSLKAQRMVSIC